jgi:hypothetical protein
MMSYIDKSTIPFCHVQKKKFDWGESYTTYNPIFKISPISEEFSLEDSIIILGENNFKKQLLLLHNAINNYEEFDRVENYYGETFNREKILKLIDFYIKKNKDYLAPWEKYNNGVMEFDYIDIMESETKKKINYCKY